MAIIYRCHHCHRLVGRLEQPYLEEEQLGLDQLTFEERRELIKHTDNGDIEIKTICEFCQDALDRNPFYHELDTFIQ
ncbi:MAG: anti-sigma-F factor Fin family protein [Bacillaceae bacterium]|nr:anti-sigma-F factor Fin family protein [Bacillaceae bacterium]